MESAVFDPAREHPAGRKPAVVIIGPPWPRSGTARVIENQIRYYHGRGFFTVFIAVPFAWHFIHSLQNRKEMIEGLNELGADRTCMAALDQKSYNAAKYKASLRHAFHGTVLDWRVAMGQAAKLSDDDVEFLRKLRPILFHVNHVYTQGFALNLRRRFLNDGLPLPIILETHDVQSQFLVEKREHNPWTRRPDRFEQLIKSETKLLEKADVLIHLSVDDFKRFRAKIPSKPQFLAFPTIDEKFSSSMRAVIATADAIDLLFLGVAHPANLAAVEWFFHKVWPLVADHRHIVKIVGPVGSMVQLKLPQLYDNFRSCFVGEVADPIPYYHAARCVIAPMVSGSGISIKTIEALALGKPFVGTSKAFRGMPMDRLRGVGIQAYDEPQAFANAIMDTLKNEAEAGTISRAAYEKVFSIEASTTSRDEALRAALDARQSKSWLWGLGLL